MEGFICPVCHQILETAGLLEIHFNSHNQDNSSVRSIFNKAKDYTLNWISNEETPPDGLSSSSSTPSPSPLLRPYQEQEQFIGRMNNLTKVFRAIRPKKVSHSQKETNRLLIRLDKLVNGILNEIMAGKRNLKDVEKSIIPWIDDSDDCVGCGRIIRSILHKKHHCRLCTGILCTGCSLFVPLQDAAIALGKPVPDLPIEHSFRFCSKCQHIIHCAQKEITAKNVDKQMELTYKKLSESMITCDKLAAEYSKISSSLREGEPGYTLDEGNDKRVQLIKQFKIVDTISEKIQTLKTDSPIQQKVQTNIRQTIRSYLQDNLPATAPLPDLKEIQILQAKRKEESKARTDRLKKAALLTQAPAKTNPTNNKQKHENTPNPDGWNTRHGKDEISPDLYPGRSRDEPSGRGWTGETVQPQRASHPLIEQREILRGYLRQARKEGREEEIETLKSSLHEVIDVIKAQRLDDS